MWAPSEEVAVLESWGRYVGRRARAVLLVGILLVLGAGAYGAGVFGSLSDGGFDDPASEAYQALETEREVFGNVGVDVVAIYSSDTLTVDDPAFVRAVRDAVGGLDPDATTQVVTWADADDPTLVSEDRHSAQVLVSLSGETQEEAGAAYERIEDQLVAGGGLRTDVAGTWATYADVNATVSEDLKRAELLSLPVVAVLSLVIFGSAVAASMPVLVGVAAVLGSLAVVRVTTLVADVSVFSINVITLIGMGLAIDYALFVVSRFREELAKLPDVRPVGPDGRRRGADREAARAALVTTMGTAGRTVMFSGLTVAVAMSSLLIFPQVFLRSMGYGGMSAVLVAMVAALTLLPAVLVLLGRRVDAGRVPLLHRRRRSGGEGGEDAGVIGAAGAPTPTGVPTVTGAWARVAAAVMRRPVLVSVGLVVALLALASPFLHVSWGSVDYRGLPADAPSHVAGDRLARDFGGETSSAEILVTGVADVVGKEPAQAVRAPALVAYVDRLEAVEPVRAAEVVDVDDARGGTVLVRATWPGNSQEPVSLDAVTGLRGVAPPPGAEAQVGGLPADTVDLLDSLGAHLPWMAGIVVVAMFVLLFLAFGSLVLPVKAIAMNVLSIGAAFGVVTWIFGDGHLAGLLDFTPTGYVDATNPILMLAVLFGLSMDYEVFLLSRVREQWDLTGDNDLAVAAGVQKTGRIITSAALLLGVVIGAFSLSGVTFMKMLGIGMLVALLIDATVVRALLVPATMKLLGRWNWWAPAPMLRWWERHGVREG